MERKWCQTFVSTLILLFSPILPGLHAQLNMTLGLYGGGFFYSEINPAVYTIGSGETAFLLDYRTDYVGGNYFLVNTKVDVKAVTNPAWIVYDTERVGTLSFLQTDLGDFIIKTKLLSSLFGDPLSFGSYVNPEYNLRLLIDQGKYFVFIEAVGGAWFKSMNRDDYLLQGGRLGLRFEPSMKTVHEMSIGLSYMGFLESATWVSTGPLSAVHTSAMREDYTLTCDFRTEGITDFSVSWSWGLTMAMLLSNANEFYPFIGYLDYKSEDRFILTLDGTLGWQVNDSLYVEYIPVVSFSPYMVREALTEFALSLKGEKCYTFDLSGTVRLEWMLVKYMNIVAEAMYKQVFANDQLLQVTDIRLRCGVEYTF